MARTPSMTTAQCEAALGARGELIVTDDNRRTVRKWLVALGMPAMLAGRATNKQLAWCYNDKTNRGIDMVRATLLQRFGANGNAADMGDNEAADDAPAVEAPAVNGHANGNAASAIEQAIRTIAEQVAPKAPQIDADAVRVIVADEIAKATLTPRQVNVTINGGTPVAINERVHLMFDRVLKLLGQGENVLMVGPAGCGKTHLARQVAKALNARKFGAIHGSAGASESALTGWLLPSDGGRFEYQASEFVDIYENGGAFLWDELDAFDPNMLLVANGALANGHLHIAHRRDKPCVLKAANVFLMATANTFGTSADPMYSSRNALDTATLDRFVYVEMDYDRDLELSIAQGAGLSASEIASLWQLRERVREQKLRRCISTRAIQKACSLKAIGDEWSAIISTLTLGWTRDEKQKAGV